MQFINYGIKNFKINSKIYFNFEIKEGFNTRNKKAKFLCDLTEYLGVIFFYLAQMEKNIFKLMIMNILNPKK